MIACHCVICNKFIGNFYPSLTRKTCSRECTNILTSRNNTGKNNPNYRHGKNILNLCKKCGKKITHSASHCNKCKKNNFKGKKHSKQSLAKIGIASRKKFTQEYKTSQRKRYKGTKKRAINGYILIKDYTHKNRNSHNDVLEHIAVMSKSLNRPIIKGEIIHHINFIRDDNRIENLYLYESRAKHTQMHGKIFKLIQKLLELDIVEFKNGEYKMKESLKIVGGRL